MFAKSKARKRASNKNWKGAFRHAQTKKFEWDNPRDPSDRSLGANKDALVLISSFVAFPLTTVSTRDLLKSKKSELAMIADEVRDDLVESQSREETHETCLRALKKMRGTLNDYNQDDKWCIKRCDELLEALELYWEEPKAAWRKARPGY